MKHKKSSSVMEALLVVAVLVLFFSLGLMTDEGNQITGAATGMEEVSGMATEAPPPPKGAPSSGAPSAPKPSLDNVPVGEVTLANDGSYYYKYKDGSTKRYINNQWQDIKYTYDVTVRDSSGITKTMKVEGTTLTDAKKQVPGGFTIISTRKPTTSITESIEVFIVDSIGGTEVVTNGAQTYFIPQGKTAEQYATELNYKATINNEYSMWLKDQNLQDTNKNRELFNKYPPYNINKGLIVETLGITTAKGEEGKKDEPYTKMKLPDGNYMFIYGGKEYLGGKTGNTPSNLQSILSFKDDHPTAKQTDFVAVGGQPVFIEGGNYILQTTQRGSKFDGEAIKKEKIGGEDYDVTYSLKDGKATPTKIGFSKSFLKSIGSNSGIVSPNYFNLNSNVLNQLKQTVGKGDKLYVSG